MTELEAIEAVYQRMASEWPPLQASVPLKFDNELGEVSSSWCRINVRQSTSEQTTMGSAPSRRFERRGSVFVELYAPIDQGRRPLALMAQSAREVLEGVTLDTDLHLYAARTEDLPDDGVFARAVVVVPFRFTQTR